MSRSRDAACSLSLVILGEVFWSGSVHACDNNVITLIRLQGHLLDRAELLLAEDLDLVGVDDFWGEGRVNTHDALIAMTKLPLFLTNMLAFRPRIRA